MASIELSVIRDLVAIFSFVIGLTYYILNLSARVKGAASKVKQLTEKLAVVRGLKQIKRAILKS